MNDLDAEWEHYQRTGAGQIERWGVVMDLVRRDIIKSAAWPIRPVIKLWFWVFDQLGRWNAHRYRGR